MTPEHAAHLAARWPTIAPDHRGDVEEAACIMIEGGATVPEADRAALADYWRRHPVEKQGEFL